MDIPKRTLVMAGVVIAFLLLAGAKPDEEKTLKLVLAHHKGTVLYAYTEGRTLNYLLCTEKGEIRFIAVTPSILGTHIDHAELLNSEEIKCIPPTPAKKS